MNEAKSALNILRNFGAVSEEIESHKTDFDKLDKKFTERKARQKDCGFRQVDYRNPKHNRWFTI